MAQKKFEELDLKNAFLFAAALEKNPRPVSAKLNPFLPDENGCVWADFRPLHSASPDCSLPGAEIREHRFWNVM